MATVAGDLGAQRTGAGVDGVLRGRAFEAGGVEALAVGGDRRRARVVPAATVAGDLALSAPVLSMLYCETVESLKLAT